ncbi:S-adenosyl-L-methionine-dependent methyltransferase [Xylariaceae sp. FL0804]|nr:S-adenosyl-L-methionine-dependent methyltransferase [Xylariaceae sp. FL0804]
MATSLAPDRGKVQLTPAEELEFVSVFLQAQDAASPAPVLGDTTAERIINKVDCDFTKSIFTTDPRTVQTLVRRTRLHDQWLQHFLDAHDAADAGGDGAPVPVTVLCVGAGLDNRSLRVRRGPNVRWVDVDAPATVGLRRRLIPPAHGDYTLIAARLTDDDWLESIPADRPTYIIAEEVLMWMAPRDGRRLIRRLVHRFPGGQFATDVIGSMIKELSWLMPLMRQSHVHFRWAVNDARSGIERLSRRLRLAETVRWYEMLDRGGVVVDSSTAAAAAAATPSSAAATVASVRRSPASVSTLSLARFTSHAGNAASASAAVDDDGRSAMTTTTKGSASANKDGPGAESPSFFGRWTALAARLPGFKSCAQVLLFDFGEDVAAAAAAAGSGGLGGGGLLRPSTGYAHSFMTLNENDDDDDDDHNDDDGHHHHHDDGYYHKQQQQHHHHHRDPTTGGGGSSSPLSAADSTISYFGNLALSDAAGTRGGGRGGGGRTPSGGAGGGAGIISSRIRPRGDAAPSASGSATSTTSGHSSNSGHSRSSGGSSNNSNNSSNHNHHHNHHTSGGIGNRLRSGGSSSGSAGNLLLSRRSMSARLVGARSGGGVGGAVGERGDGSTRQQQQPQRQHSSGGGGGGTRAARADSVVRDDFSEWLATPYKSS